jgi:hypothetical protein
MSDVSDAADVADTKDVSDAGRTDAGTDAKAGTGAGATAVAGTDAGKDKAQTDKGATGGDGKAGAKDTAAQRDTIAAGTGDEDGDDKRRAPAPDFPEDWRQRLAGEDKADLKRLDRYQSPKGLWTKVKNLEKALSEKSADKPRPADDDADALKAWREERGVPEKAEAYLENLKLPSGKQLGDTDKPIAAHYAEFALKHDLPQEAVNKNVEWYYNYLEHLQAQQAEEDDGFHDEAVDALKEEWGVADYKRNINAIGVLFVDAPEGIKDKVLASRTPDGRLLGDDPTVLKWLTTVAKEAKPGATLVPASSGGGVKGLQERRKEIEKVMRTDRRAYNQDEPLQQEYREVLDAIERHASRTRAA